MEEIFGGGRESNWQLRQLLAVDRNHLAVRVSLLSIFNLLLTAAYPLNRTQEIIAARRDALREGESEKANRRRIGPRPVKGESDKGQSDSDFANRTSGRTEVKIERNRLPAEAQESVAIYESGIRSASGKSRVKAGKDV